MSACAGCAPRRSGRLDEHKVTHLCGAPIVMSTLLNAPMRKARAPAEGRVLHRRRAAARSGAAAMAEPGFNVTHLYGLTETYGPAVVNDWQAEPGTICRWSGGAPPKGAPGRALSRARRPDGDGPGNHAARARRWRDHGRGDVPRQCRDEGLSEEPEGDREAFAGGWFHTGDLGVLHPDGYIQLKDRSKDIIISGGENISSIEVEDASTSIPPCRRRPWWPSPTTSGARRPAPSSN
jgi:fatty-acyl-CoA synthase